MKTLVQINTDYYKNISNTDTPMWQYRGEHQFMMETNPINFIQKDDSCRRAIELMLFEESSETTRYELVSFKLIEQPSRFHETLFIEKLMQVEAIDEEVYSE